MPNWCENDLEVSNWSADPKAQEQFNSFRDKALQNKNEFNQYPLLSNLYPMPDELKETTKGSDSQPNPILKAKYGVDNWYDWCVEKWGTKWDVEASVADDDEDRIIFTFMSAWSPPTDWLTKIAKDYPLLHFKMKYDEPGMGFMGVTSGSEGKTQDACVQY